MKEARTLYETAQTADPQNLTIALRLGEVLRLQGRAVAALEQFEQLLRVYPEHWSARVERALSLLALGREDQVARELQRLLAKREDPKLRALLEELSD